MAIIQEVNSTELQESTKAISNPLMSSTENTGFHANDNFVKEGRIFNPAENDLKKERSGVDFCMTAMNSAQQRRKPLAASNTNPKVPLASEKENGVSCSSNSAFGLNLCKSGTRQCRTTGSKLTFKDIKRPHKVLKPRSQCEENVLNDVTGRPHESTNTVVPENVSGTATTSSEGWQGQHSKTKLKHPLEGSFFREEDCCQISIEQPVTTNLVKERNLVDATQIGESFDAANFSAESIESPLLSSLADQSEIGILCGREGSNDSFLHRQMHNICEKTRHLSDTGLEIKCGKRCSYELSMGPRSRHSPYNQDAEASMEHLVVFFSPQKVLQEYRSRLNRQKLLKIGSVFSVYAHKIARWVKRLCKEKNIVYCVPCLQKIFTPARRGFVKLDSQQLPEYSTKFSSPSLKKELAKDHELRAVLLKINEVLASMDRASSDNILNSNSPEV